MFSVPSVVKIKNPNLRGKDWGLEKYIKRPPLPAEGLLLHCQGGQVSWLAASYRSAESRRIPHAFPDRVQWLKPLTGSRFKAYGFSASLSPCALRPCGFLWVSFRLQLRGSGGFAPPSLADLYETAIRVGILDCNNRLECHRQRFPHPLLTPPRNTFFSYLHTL